MVRQSHAHGPTETDTQNSDARVCLSTRASHAPILCPHWPNIDHNRCSESDCCQPDKYRMHHNAICSRHRHRKRTYCKRMAPTFVNNAGTSNLQLHRCCIAGCNTST
mmetsp:Transcript_4700/g.7566  ORF Transcript_4700/g.7566 Transcript_4700/m.7566 type:complete len:107 (-) Transcript_4700:390-710(-)